MLKTKVINGNLNYKRSDQTLRNSPVDYFSKGASWRVGRISKRNLVGEFDLKRLSKRSVVKKFKSK